MSNFMISLNVMWMGMLGIFTVILVIMAIVYGLGKIKFKSKD